MLVRLREANVPIAGINWWPLYQAVEWGYRDQPDRPLGDFLVAGGWNNGLYDLAQPSLDRVATPAVEAFRQIVMRDPKSASRRRGRWERLAR
jgi:hypothetical protein